MYTLISFKYTANTEKLYVNVHTCRLSLGVTIMGAFHSLHFD